jgi:cell division protease FtsH
LRPGRFDRRVILELPDRQERVQILGLHLEKKPVGPDVNLDRIAAATPGASGADLKNITNEAAILAARDGAKQLTQRYLEHAIEKVLIGPERKSKVMSEAEKAVTAYHEVGHALVGHFLPDTDPIHKISLVSRGSALGYTWSLPDEDHRLTRRSKFNDEIAQALGGRVAEQLVYGEMTTGASNDLEKATKIARDMVRVYGMSDKLGPITFGVREEAVFLGRDFNEHRSYSEEIARQIDAEVNRIVTDAEKRAHAVLTKHRHLLDSVAKRLLETETIDRDEFEQLVATTEHHASKAIASK